MGGHIRGFPLVIGVVVTLEIDIEAGLVRDARRGDAVAVARLFDICWLDAWRVAVGVTGDAAAADDVAQEGFLKAMRSLHGFDGRRPFRVWLHRIVANEGRDHLRRERRRGQLQTQLSNESLPAEMASEVPGLTEALLDLSADQRAVLFLHFWVGHTVDEVGVVLGVPAGTVRSRLGRAMHALRAHPDLQAIARSSDV